MVVRIILLNDQSKEVRDVGAYSFYNVSLLFDLRIIRHFRNCLSAINGSLSINDNGNRFPSFPTYLLKI